MEYTILFFHACHLCWLPLRISSVVLPPDDQPPLIQCPENTTLLTDSGNSTRLHEFLIDAEDNSNYTTINCSTPVVTYFPLGYTEVMCSAWDNSSNIATCSFHINVIGKNSRIIRKRSLPFLWFTEWELTTIIIITVFCLQQRSNGESNGRGNIKI